MSQLADLAVPFPASMVCPPAQGKYGDYVPHPEVTQRLLLHLGGYSFEVREILREQVKGSDHPIIVGVVARLTVTIDGREHSIDEAGDCENPTTKRHDGERLKDASSDAIKRCAMRIGLGLHLWSSTYFLPASLAKRGQEADGPGVPDA